jgi:hypothetical protein
MRVPLSVVLLVAGLAVCPATEAASRWWFGGGIGLGVGDRDFFEINGVVGYRATPRFTPGLRVTYRNSEVRDGNSSLTTDDYGASLFGRYRIWKPIYAQVEYEYLSYEFVGRDFSAERETFGSLLGGAGVAFPLSDKIGLFATALYNFSYDDNEIPRPYSSPWVFRTGVGFSF